MRPRWTRWARRFGLIVPGVLVAGAATVFLMSRDWAPAPPDSIVRGDHTYTRELAEYRFAELLERHHVPGGAAALIVDQEIVWQATAGMADVAAARPVTERTVFKLWSLAKVFTALETMRLVEEGVLDLDTPITSYVPGFHVPSRFGPGEPITVRHLLTHHSGLPRNTGVDESTWHLGPDGIERFAATLADCRLAYPTGQRFKYSNAGVDLLGYLIQAERGEIFQPYMQRALLRPIGMADSAFWSTDVPADRFVATGYAYVEGEQLPLTQHDVATVPAGNLYGSLADLIAFVRFVLRDGEVSGGQLIRAETLAAMTEDHGSRREDPQPTGLGWRLSRAIPGELLVWHDGGPSEGCGVQVALLPERGLGAVFVGNGTAFESRFVMPVVVELLAALLAAETGAAPAARPPPAAVDVAASELAAVAGDYVAFGRVLEVRLAGERLVATIDGMSLDVVPRSAATFGLSHWVGRWGLARLFGLPLDLDTVEIEHQPGSGDAEDRLVIDIGDIGFEIAPRYVPLPGGGASWEPLTGVYERRSRLPDGAVGSDVHGTAEIRIVDGRLLMSDPLGPLRPLDAETLVILGGPFAGETIVRDPDTGTLAHQGYVYSRGD